MPPPARTSAGVQGATPCYTERGEAGQPRAPAALRAYSSGQFLLLHLPLCIAGKQGQYLTDTKSDNDDNTSNLSEHESDTTSDEPSQIISFSLYPNF